MIVEMIEKRIDVSTPRKRLMLRRRSWVLLTNNERAEEVVEGCVCFVPNCCYNVSVRVVVSGGFPAV